MENLILKTQTGRTGHTFASLNPWTIIAIGLALENLLCNKRFQKLNGLRPRCQMLNIDGIGFAVCTKNTDAQPRLLPGDSVINPRVCEP